MCAHTHTKYSAFLIFEVIKLLLIWNLDQISISLKVGIRNFLSLYPSGCSVNDGGKKGRNGGREWGSMKEDLLVQKPRAGKFPVEKRLLSPRTPQTAGAGFITPISATSPGWGGLFSYGPGCYLDKGSTKPSLWPEVLAPLVLCVHRELLPGLGTCCQEAGTAWGAPSRPTKQIGTLLLRPVTLPWDTLPCWLKSSLNRCCVPKKPCLWSMGENLSSKGVFPTERALRGVLAEIKPKSPGFLSPGIYDFSLERLPPLTVLPKGKGRREREGGQKSHWAGLDVAPGGIQPHIYQRKLSPRAWSFLCLAFHHARHCIQMVLRTGIAFRNRSQIPTNSGFPRAMGAICPGCRQ